MHVCVDKKQEDHKHLVVHAAVGFDAVRAPRHAVWWVR